MTSFREISHTDLLLLIVCLILHPIRFLDLYKTLFTVLHMVVFLFLLLIVFNSMHTILFHVLMLMLFRVLLLFCFLYCSLLTSCIVAVAVPCLSIDRSIPLFIPSAFEL